MTLANSHFLTGVSFFEENDIENAIVHLTRVKELTPNCDITHQWLVICQNI